MMKKNISLLLIAMLLASLCLPSAFAEKKLKVVAATFPLYDWTRQVVGENDQVEITLLLDSGVDLHSFNPTAADILKIATCDVFIYVGGESDEWVEDALKKGTNSSLRPICLLEELGEAAKEEELVEGMEAGEDHDHDHDDDHGDEDHDDHDHEDEAEYDEHVWLSLRNAQLFAGVIADTLAELDPDNGEAYWANAAAYQEKLAALDARYAAMVEAADYKTVLFGDRFPFRYLTDDYGLDYYAAFSGCSAETEASFQTIVFLAGKVDELDLPAVLTIEGTDHRIAETIVSSTRQKNQQVLTVDSMQGTTAADVEAGKTYLAIMEKNLSVFEQALNRD